MGQSDPAFWTSVLICQFPRESEDAAGLPRGVFSGLWSMFGMSGRESTESPLSLPCSWKC